MIATKLKIGLDYHGVIDSDPEYFKDFCLYARSQGHLIYILSGSPKAMLTKLLQDFDLPYDYAFSILDYCIALRRVEQNAQNLTINDIAWNRAKADFCRRCKIDVHIDDSTIYLKYFDQAYCLYNNQKQQCQTLKGGIINFNQSPQIVLEKLITTLKKPSV